MINYSVLMKWNQTPRQWNFSHFSLYTFEYFMLGNLKIDLKKGQYEKQIGMGMVGRYFIQIGNSMKKVQKWKKSCT